MSGVRQAEGDGGASREPSVGSRAGDSRVGNPSRRRPWSWLLLLALLLVSAGPSCVQNEVAQWYRAAAANAGEDGRYGEAARLYARAASWAPSDPNLALGQIDSLLAGEAPWEALAAANRLVQRSARSANESIREAGWIQRARVYQDLGQFQLALEDCHALRQLHEQQKIEQTGSRERRSSSLNGLAYARALAGEELDEALRDADAAIALWGGDAAAFAAPSFRLLAQLNQLVAQRERDEAAARLANRLTVVWLRELDRADQLPLPEGEYRRQLRTALNTCLARTRRLWGEVLERLERPAEAARQRALADQLNSRPAVVNEAAWPSVELVDQGELRLSALLDTRGWIRYRAGDLPGALLDLELAVRRDQRSYRRWAQAKRQLLMAGLSESRVAEQERQLARQLAVLLYHRAQIREALPGDHKPLVDKDYEAIRELGFEPSPALF